MKNIENNNWDIKFKEHADFINNNPDVLKITELFSKIDSNTENSLKINKIFNFINENLNTKNKLEEFKSKLV